MNARIDRRMAELAGGQHGVVTRRQLLAAGFTGRQIGWRLEVGALHRVHAGVYLLGELRGALEPARAREMAALLACGPEAFISHGHAAALWGLGPPPPADDPIDVIIPGDRVPPRRAGIAGHRASDWRPEDAARIDGVAVTAPARTLADLAGRVTRRALERAVGRADRRGLVNDRELKRLVARQRGRRGAGQLRTVILRDGGVAFTRSEAEGRFLELIRGSGLPTPVVNSVLHGYELDFHWPDRGVAVEIDGFAYHRSRHSFRADRRRDARLFSAAGVSVLRFTWEQITREPKATLVTLVRALDRASGPATRRRVRPVDTPRVRD